MRALPLNERAGIVRLKERQQFLLMKILVAGLILMMLALYFFDSIFITVYPGYDAVLFRRIVMRGLVMDRIYTPGMHVIWPWDKLYVYDTRIQTRRQKINVLSQNGLTIEVTVAVRYHIDKNRLPELHNFVGEEYEDKVIVPSITSSVREVMGSYIPEEIYTVARHTMQDAMLVELVSATGRVPIMYDEFAVEEIKLPEIINAAIENKLKQQQQFLEYAYRIQREEAEAERRRIEAGGIRAYQNIIAESLSNQLLTWTGIQASMELAKSPNSKVVVFGNSENGLPLILDAKDPPIPAVGPKVSADGDPASQGNETGVRSNPPENSPLKAAKPPGGLSVRTRGGQ